MQTSSDTTHGPPEPLDDDAVLMPRPPARPDEVRARTAVRAHLTASPAYRLLAVKLSARLGPTEPMDLVRAMASGRYRWRRRDGALLLENGQPLPDHMSFRAIAAELERLVDEELVTYETLRRWWAKVWPGTTIPAEPARQAAAEVGFLARRQAAAARSADAVDAATAEAAAEQTNPEVPPAAFLPPE